MDNSIRKLIHLLDSLFELSQKQVDALDRRALGDLENILRAKDDLLKRLGDELAQLSASGVLVMDAKTYPTDPDIRARLSATANRVRRYQAHEKSIVARTKGLRDDLSRELRSLRKRRQGLASYSKPGPNRRFPTMTG
jgi:hypothetical protein